MITITSNPPLQPLAQAPAWWTLVLVSALALGLGWLLLQLGNARAFAALRRWIPMLLVGLGLGVVALWLRRLVPDEGAHGLARAAMLIVIAIAALPWLRDLFYAFVFGFENRYRLGDDLRVGEAEGRLASIGPRAIVLRASDGTEITIPHSKLAREQVVRLNLEIRDAPCELILAVPPDLDVEVAAERARIAAALSPYAAPRCRPTVFIDSEDAAQGARLRLRGFVFDREYEPLYRSDVGTRFMRMIRESGASPARAS